MTPETEASQTSLEKLYRTHHANRRGDDFVLLGDARGAFLKKNIGKGKRVLDIGCRDGALTASFAEGNTVTGADIDTDALNRAKQKLGIETRHLDLNGDWGIAPDSFDVVVAAEVLEHLYYPDTVTKKVATILKPDGVFLGTVPNAFSIKNRLRLLMLHKRHTPLADPTHINQFIVTELEGILSQHFRHVTVIGAGNAGVLAEKFPQQFAFDLMFRAAEPISN